MSTKTENGTRQISARLKDNVYRAFKKKLERDGLTLQDFMRTVVHGYIKDMLSLRKEFHMEVSPADALHLELQHGKGYEADSIEDLFDQLENKKKSRPIR